MTMRTMHRGFTMIELLMVIAIIGLLASIVLSTLSTAQAKARDTQRLQDLRQIQTALETYRTAIGSYPSTGSVAPGTIVYWGGCGNYPGAQQAFSGSSGWIPNLAPTYIAELPRDPRPNTPSSGNCYVYASDGRDYMLMAYGTVETFRSTDANNGTCVPTRNSTDTNPANRPSQPTEADVAFFTPGACRW